MVARKSNFSRYQKNAKTSVPVGREDYLKRKTEGKSLKPSDARNAARGTRSLVADGMGPVQIYS